MSIGKARQRGDAVSEMKRSAATKAASFSLSVPSTAAGSSKCPNAPSSAGPARSDRTSPAALSQTVNTKSITGAIGFGKFIPAF